MPPSAGIHIAAVVAAAGRSTRMGRPKQLLPFGERTVLAAVVAHLAEAGADPVLCVVGHLADEMRNALRTSPAHLIYNPDYLAGEMLSSYQAGIRALAGALAGGSPSPWTGALLALGDQPHVPVSAIRQVVDQAMLQPESIVIPSFAMRRGHPFYLPAQLWPELLALAGERTLRHLLQQHADAIAYVDVETDAVLRDMDTPEQYLAALASTTQSGA